MTEKTWTGAVQYFMSAIRRNAYGYEPSKRGPFASLTQEEAKCVLSAYEMYPGDSTARAFAKSYYSIRDRAYFDAHYPPTGEAVAISPDVLAVVAAVEERLKAVVAKPPASPSPSPTGVRVNRVPSERKRKSVYSLPPAPLTATASLFTPPPTDVLAAAALTAAAAATASAVSVPVPLVVAPSSPVPCAATASSSRPSAPAPLVVTTEEEEAEARAPQAKKPRRTVEEAVQKIRDTDAEPYVFRTGAVVAPPPPPASVAVDTMPPMSSDPRFRAAYDAARIDQAILDAEKTLTSANRSVQKIRKEIDAHTRSLEKAQLSVSRAATVYAECLNARSAATAAKIRLFASTSASASSAAAAADDQP